MMICFNLNDRLILIFHNFIERSLNFEYIYINYEILFLSFYSINL